MGKLLRFPTISQSLANEFFQERFSGRDLDGAEAWAPADGLAVTSLGGRGPRLLRQRILKPRQQVPRGAVSRPFARSWSRNLSHAKLVRPAGTRAVPRNYSAS